MDDKELDVKLAKLKSRLQTYYRVRARSKEYEIELTRSFEKVYNLGVRFVCVTLQNGQERVFELIKKDDRVQVGHFGDLISYLDNTDIVYAKANGNEQEKAALAWWEVYGCIRIADCDLDYENIRLQELWFELTEGDL